MRFSQLVILGAALVTTFTAGARVKSGAVVDAELKSMNENMTQVAKQEKEGPFEMEEHREDFLQEALNRSKKPDDYKEIYTDFKCSRNNKKVCPQCKYARKTAKCEDYRAGDKVDVDTFPIRIARPEDGLPEEVQGVMWLTKQGKSSALVSFAPSEDGGGLSGLDENGLGRVRVSGDRVWSFHDNQPEGNFDSAEKADLIYTFNFYNKTAPRHAQIHPAARNYHIKLGRLMEWLTDFEMDLLQCPKDPKTSDDPYCKDLIPEFQDSVVWQRKSYFFGKHREDADYKAVQVIKADGTKLPAFYKWLDYCNSPDTGDTPGEFHYHEVDNSKKCFKKKSWLSRKFR